jgi:hypothetical protein
MHLEEEKVHTTFQRSQHQALGLQDEAHFAQELRVSTLLLLLLPPLPLDFTKTSDQTPLFLPPLSLCLDLSIDIVEDIDDSEAGKEKEKIFNNWVPMA